MNTRTPKQSMTLIDKVAKDNDNFFRKHNFERSERQAFLVKVIAEFAIELVSPKDFAETTASMMADAFELLNDQHDYKNMTTNSNETTNISVRSSKGTAIDIDVPSHLVESDDKDEIGRNILNYLNEQGIIDNPYDEDTMEIHGGGLATSYFNLYMALSEEDKEKVNKDVGAGLTMKNAIANHAPKDLYEEHING